VDWGTGARVLRIPPGHLAQRQDALQPELGLEVFHSLTPAGRVDGYATEAAAGIINYALSPVGLTEVFAEVDEGNRASAAVIERLGMTGFVTRLEASGIALGGAAGRASRVGAARPRSLTSSPRSQDSASVSCTPPSVVAEANT
jgi:hypothetical protein